MIFDSHIHTKFSSDSIMSLAEAQAKAEALGIGIITTEHMDLKYPDAGKFIFSVADYFAAYQQYRSDKMLLGIEIGMRADCTAENMAIASQADFDYVLGSIHMVGDHDLYFPNFYQGKTKQTAYREYLMTMADCLRKNKFIDALAHIDYIARYAPYQDKQLYYAEYADIIDSILRLLIESETALELNTRRLAQTVTQQALLPIYQRYRELGGRLITLGSDAHTAVAVGSNFALAQDFAQVCKLQFVFYKNRQINFMK